MWSKPAIYRAETNISEKGKVQRSVHHVSHRATKDQKFGEAYYRLALTELKTDQPFAAVQSLRRAVELLKPQQPERMDARIKLADVYLDYLERSSKREAKSWTRSIAPVTI